MDEVVKVLTWDGYVEEMREHPGFQRLGSQVSSLFNEENKPMPDTLRDHIRDLLMLSSYLATVGDREAEELIDQVVMSGLLEYLRGTLTLDILESQFVRVIESAKKLAGIYQIEVFSIAASSEDEAIEKAKLYLDGRTDKPQA